MKKFFVFILIALLLCGINFASSKKLSLNSIFPDGDVEVYFSQNIEMSEFYTQRNGNGTILFCSSDKLLYILNNYSVSGYTIKIKNLSVCDVLKKISPNYYFSNGCGVYGYFSYFNDYVLVNDRAVNFHVKESDGCVLLGCPILLGSY